MGAPDHNRSVRISLTALIATTALFALWGIGHRLYDTLLPQFARAFSLEGFALAAAGGVYSISYFIWALPAALCTRRFGYRTTIVFGLGIACIGAFLLFPAGETQAFHYFLIAASVMSLGWVLLEVAANPLMLCLGSRRNAVQRLNLAQSFYVPGTLAGYLIARWLIQVHDGSPAAHLARSITHPFIVFAAVLLLMTIVIEDVRYPAAATERVRGWKEPGREIAALLSRPLFLGAVIAQAMSVIALAATWTVAGPLLQQAFPPAITAQWGGVIIWTVVLFGAGRLIGTGLMTWIAPERLLAIFSLLGFIAGIAALMTGGPAAALIVLASNLFLSILWPTILGLAVADLGPAMKIGTALICMGGAAGGFIHRLISAYFYNGAPHVGVIAMTVAYAAVTLFALWFTRPELQPSAH
jgi:FHS family L-fucose permease-like MFS transporter